jgi:trehalose 6-phosphate phosphatase
METYGDRWDVFRRAPEAAAILTDFDGTLAAIVDDPAAARPLDGVPALLDELADRYALVAVLSGRPVAFLQQLLSERIVLSGLYGLEVVRDGSRRDHPSGEAWREVVAAVTTAARTHGPEGMRVEPKGLSLTVHYRGDPGLEAAVRDWAEHEAARSGLLVRDARMSIELHPPIAADKGTAVTELAGSFDAVCFIGDDRGDLPAFAALDELAARGAGTVRVAVRSDEAPPELLARADLVVEGPEGAAALLRSL